MAEIKNELRVTTLALTAEVEGSIEGPYIGLYDPFLVHGYDAVQTLEAIFSKYLLAILYIDDKVTLSRVLLILQLT